MSRARTLWSHTITRNVVALYWAQVAVVVLPLVTLPYLARVLGPEGLGPVVVAQALGLWLGTIIEYGFNLGATRDVAREREDPAALGQTVSGVLGAKLILVGGSVFLAAAALAVPALRANPELLVLGWLTAVAQGLYPLWFFQGMERLRLPATLEVLGRGATAALILVLVRDADDGWVVLALQAGTGLIGLVVATMIMYRSVPALRPRLSSAVDMLRRARHLFVYNGAVSLYSSANALVLGLLAPGPQVAFFGAAEKLTRAAGRLTTPISQAVFPRMSLLVARDAQARARRLALLTLVILMALTLIGSTVLILFAPTIVSVLFGSEFEQATSVLRILALTIPLVALSSVLGQQWMIPRGMDRPFVRVILFAGLLNLVLAAALVPSFGANGMAWALVTTELAVVCGLTVAIRRGRGLATAPMVPAAGAERPG